MSDPYFQDRPALEVLDFEQSPTIGKLMEALSKAQGAMPAPLKNKKNPHFGSYYADHAAVVECSKPHLAANGLAIVQGVGSKDDKVIVTTLLGHTSGEWIKSRLGLKPDRPNVQGVASASTYGRRYGHCAILNLAPDDDDDGNAAALGPKQSPAYVGSDEQKIVLKNIFKDLSVTDDEVKKKIANKALGVGKPMHELADFVKKEMGNGLKSV